MATTSTAPPPSDGPRGPSTRAKIVLLVLSAVLLTFSTGATPIPLAAWLVGVFALRFGRVTRPGRGYLALSLVSVPVLALAWSIFPFGGPVGLVILAVVAGFTSALPILFDRLVSTRLDGFLRTLPYPAAATTVDFLLGSNPDFGSWGATGYSQIDSLAIMQVSSVTGLLGLTFLTAWFAAAVNGVWEAKGDLRRSWRPAVPAFATILVVLVAGQARLAFTSSPTELLEVTAIGGPRVNVFPSRELSERWESGDPLEPEEIEALRSHQAADNRAILDAAERAAKAGSDLVTWGEGAVVVLSEDLAALEAELGVLARAHSSTLVAPILVLPTDAGERRWDNQALFVAPDGEIEWSYRKAVPTPGRERAISLRGDGELLSSEIEGARVGALICYDLDFPELVAQTAGEGVDILVGPAGDWPEVAVPHAKMARARAIEQGIVLVRPTSGGVSVIYDGLGRVLARTSTTDGSVRSISTWVPTHRRATLHATFSRVLAWLMLVLALVLVGVRIARREQSARNG